MPYIPDSDRVMIDPSIEDLCFSVRELDGQPVASPGVVNYIISSLVAILMKPPMGWTYSSLSKALAVFRDAEAEMRRRLLEPYEDKAIEKNGDIHEYE